MKSKPKNFNTSFSAAFNTAVKTSPSKKQFRNFLGLFLIITLTFVLASSASFAKQPVKLTTKIWPPYHYFDNNGKLTGVSVEVIHCAFKTIDREVSIQVMPWKRAQQEVKDNESNGFFSASWNEKRDQFAIRSVDIAEQKWSWFYLDSTIDPDDIEFKSQYKVTATTGSNIETWLKQNNYKLNSIVSETTQMIHMLVANRTRIFLANELVVEQYIKQEKLTAPFLKSTARSMPVGIYFSKEFLNGESGDFLDRLNNAIHDCRFSLESDLKQNNIIQ